MNTHNNGDLAQRIIQHAARRGPPGLSERLEEEWLADLQARRGALSRLRLAIGCCWATRVIAREFAVPKVLAAASTTGGRSMAAYADPGFLSFSRRSITVFLILALHVALIYVFATGLGNRILKIVPPHFVGGIIEGTPRPQPPPPPARPDLQQWKVQIPDNLFPFQTESSGDSITAPPSHQEEPAGPAPAPPHLVKRIQGGPGAGFPNTDDFYPADLIRRGERGIVTVRTCVDERGKLTGLPTVAQTSGSAGIDNAALKLARAGSGHYRATTEDGQPVSSCYDFRIRFDLRN